MAPTTPSLLIALLTLTLGLGVATNSPGDEAAPAVIIRVQAGAHARINTPVRVDLGGDLGDQLRAVIPSRGHEPSPVYLYEIRDDGTRDDPIPAQLDAAPAGSEAKGRLTWILRGKTPAGASRRFALPTSPPAKRPSGSWTFSNSSESPLELKHLGRPVFCYNTQPVSNPKYPPVQTRDAYLHPAYTPSGKLITGDFSTHHTHHRGFFLAYTKTQVGSLHPDFWNFQTGSGKVVFDRLDRAVAGPVTARIESRHDWKATRGGVVLEEQWEIEAFDIPESPYWLFDLTSTQQATGEPLELLPYRYGGMAYRGPEPFVKGPLDVLTSEGLNRLKGDQKPARWVDLTGPVETDSTEYGGAMILDHPSNVNHPTVARIHPILLPFFCYVPGHDIKVSIGSESPTRFRYRVVIHDGHPNPTRNEQLWRDFAEPPQVVVEPATGGH